MEHNKRQDDMEEFFRKAFDELGDGPAADGWDVPSTKVWAGIQGGLPAAGAPARPAARRKAWGVLLLLLLLLPLGFLYWQNRTLERRLEQQAMAMQRLQASLDSLHHQPKQPLVGENTETTEASALLAARPEPQTAFEIDQIAPNALKLEIASARQWNEAASRRAAGKAGDEARVSASRPSDLTPHSWIREQEAANGKSEYATPVLAPLAAKPAAALTPKTVLPPTLLLAPAPRRAAAAKPAFYLGVYTAYNQTSRVVGHRAGQPGRALFEAQEDGQGALEWGLRAGLQLSRRWALESGLSTFGLQQESRQAFRVQYDPERERPVGGGQMEATYALAVPSAYGTSELEIDVQRAAGQRLVPGTYLAIEAHSQQRLRFVSIPLSARYQLVDRRFQLGLKGGLALSFLQSSSLQTAVQSRRAGLTVLDTRVRERFSELRSTNLDCLLGLSAHYRLSSRWSAGLEPTYRHNLQPLAEGINFASSAYAWGLQAGLNFRF